MNRPRQPLVTWKEEYSFSLVEEFSQFINSVRIRTSESPRPATRLCDVGTKTDGNNGHAQSEKINSHTLTFEFHVLNSSSLSELILR